jgi:RNA-directed DNA polymerase
MTKLPYPFGWPARSKVRGLANRPPAITRGTSTSTTAIRTGTTTTTTGSFAPCASVSVADAVSLQELYTAWREARRGKKPSNNQLRFETFWIDNLIELQSRLNAGTWRPSRPTCFVAKLPKAREIHAPAFADRVVHHWLVPQLEAIYEPTFIFDSFSNRIGKGTHAAVSRLRDFIRQVHSGEGGGWYLQLDIANFFNSIHRPTLYALLETRLNRSSLSNAAKRATHALLQGSPLQQGVICAYTEDEHSRIPAYKRLANAAPDCGIAIGNLSSQFFANVYLDQLDQFVKHTLKAQRYIRYVDDFVIVHRDREQLAEWKAQIETFLSERLRLKLKADVRLKPIASGVDFLGYVVRPTHMVVRRRVIHHAREKLALWARAHVRPNALRGTPSDFRLIQSIWNSYSGHFSHAASSRLHEQLRRNFGWLTRALLKAKFDVRLEGKTISIASTGTKGVLP